MSNSEAAVVALIDASVFLPAAAKLAAPVTWTEVGHMRRSTRAVVKALARGGVARVVADRSLVATWRGVLLLDMLTDAGASCVLVADSVVPALAREAADAPRA